LVDRPEKPKRDHRIPGIWLASWSEMEQRANQMPGIL
jgi:hypothetical protein